jgi:hypothetical protein
MELSTRRPNSHWLQCTISKADWNAINERRAKLGLKWSVLIFPAVVDYLDRIDKGEVKVAAPEKPTEPSKPKATRKTVTKAPANKKTNSGKRVRKPANTTNEQTITELADIK